MLNEDEAIRAGYKPTPSGYFIKGVDVFKLVNGKMVPVEEVERATGIDQKKNIIDYIKGIVGDGVLEIFGDTGTGKSRIVLQVAEKALKAGKKVYFLDTERNLSDTDIKRLGGSYEYTPVFTDIMEKMRPHRIPKVDVVILDSIGFPVLTEFAMLNLHKRGQALLGMIAILGGLKQYCYKNKALAIVTNQPQSEMGLEPGEIKRPFGDKSCFATKEIWETIMIKRGKKSVIDVKSFRSRNMGYGTKIAQVDITDEGTDIRWLL
jgi:RecA/RadA recombinase